MAKLINFEQVNPEAVAIDMGAQKIFLSTDGVWVKVCNTFTSDYQHLCTYARICERTK